MTCRPLETCESFRAIFSAAEPLTPVSISSNISVPTSSLSESTFFIASIILDSSPPEAVLAIGRGSCPGFALMRNSTESAPFEVSAVGLRSTTNRTLGISRNSSSSATLFSNSAAAFMRLSVNRAERIFILSDSAYSSCSSSAISSPDISISARSFLRFSSFARISSSRAPYFIEIR